VGKTAEIYASIGGAEGCFRLATAFYGHVERDPVLRPLFPSTFKCAIGEFAAFLVQFLGGDGEHTQLRWWLSLRESHARLAIGERERDAWMTAMRATLADEAAGAELLQLFEHASAHVARSPKPDAALGGELGTLWNEQLAVERAVALIRKGRRAECIEAMEGDELRARFERSPAVHAQVLSMAARSGDAVLREYCFERLRAKPELLRERYSHRRTILHDAAGAGDAALVELVLDLDADVRNDDGRSPLYCVGNECETAGAGAVIRVLLARTSLDVNAAYGVKRCTALHMAARRGNVGAISALLDGGADLEARDSAGETALRRAVNCNKAEAARLLLERGASAHSVGSKGLTAAQAARTGAMKKLFG